MKRVRIAIAWPVVFVTLPFWMLFGALDGAYSWLSLLREIAALLFRRERK